MKLALNTKLVQQLSPQVMQHLSILQLTVTELQTFIQKQALENPLIDLEESTYDWLQTAAVKKGQLYRGSASIEQLPANERESEKNWLIEQIPLNLTPHQQELMMYLIDLLDERLFLTESIDQLAIYLQRPSDEVQELVQLLQSFEPLGVGVKNVVEFLCIHIEADDEAPKWAITFVREELDSLANFHIQTLSKRYDLSTNEVSATIAYIQQLPRMPTTSLGEATHYIVPDVFVRRMDSDWMIQMNDRMTPAIRMNELYVELLQSADKSYLQQSMRKFATLVQGIEFRHQTLYAITDYIVTKQSAFFEKGMGALQPMGLNEVAHALHMHESTISRAIKGKYMETPKGLIAFRQLFQKRIDGGITKWQIQQQIREIIENENKEKPYSDQQVEQILHTKEMYISRRTVAKYRQQLSIPNSKNRMYII